VSGAASVGPTPELDENAYWVDGGALHGWAAVYSRLAHPLAAGDQRARFMFTKVGDSATPVIERWMEHLGSLGITAGTGTSQVFWRLAVRQRSLALSAQYFGDLAAAVDGARSVTRRAANLTVAFGFFPGDPIPRWVVHDEGVPVFVGLPQHHLVRVHDPRTSLAALLSSASVKVKVHEVHPQS
jgi:hypothetical protein